MLPEQFLARLAKQPPAPAYLFLGPEGYQRRLCRESLLERVLPPDSRSDGFSQCDLEDRTLSDVLDDARSLSLFASERVIWISSAELALPRRLTAASEDDGDSKGSGSELSDYLQSPTPDTVIVFECSRFDFTGDDKPKLERVEKYYSAIKDVVEFRPFTPENIRYLAQQLAKERGLKLAGAELAALLDAVAGDATMLASEVEKLSLFMGTDRAVTLEDIRAIVPNSSQSTIFSLVSALGKRDRAAALRSLDILVREGEYLPLALTFLSTQFRLALAAKESRVANSQQALSLFQKLGVRIWRDRAEQIMFTAGAFNGNQLAMLSPKSMKPIRNSEKATRTIN